MSNSPKRKVFLYSKFARENTFRISRSTQPESVLLLGALFSLRHLYIFTRSLVTICNESLLVIAVVALGQFTIDTGLPHAGTIVHTSLHPNHGSQSRTP